jgi:multiple sugar transport system ATP-binding protein
MTIISVENVSHRYEQQITLHDISFKVNHGGRVALLGASGSGKTTLLRIIAGSEAPTHGRVLYDDVDLKDIKVFDRNIGMVFQNYALMPHWEAKRTIGFFLSLRLRQREVPERVQKVSALTGVGIDKLLDRKPDNLSGGEKQQVAIARAFARDLDILLLDEPFANLDAKLRQSARLELQRLLSEFPITTVLVTHDQTEAAAIADGVVLLHNGHIEQFGDYDSLYHDPDSLYVANFIGTHNNTFSAPVHNQRWQHPLFTIERLPFDYPNEPLSISLRAEDVQLSSEGVSAKVLSVTANYGLRHQLLEVSNDTQQWFMQAPLNILIQAGQNITCTFPQEKMLYFNQQGQRLRF